MTSFPNASMQSPPPEMLYSEQINPILDMVEYPSLLVSNRRKEIKAVNLAIITLSGYTRDELQGMCLGELLPNIEGLWTSNTKRQKLYNHEGIKSQLLTRRNREIPINLEAKKLGDHDQLFLLKLLPLSQIQEKTNLENEIEAYLSLLRALQNLDIKKALSIITQLIKRTLKAESVAIYKSVSNFPHIKKVASIENLCVFPGKISTSDLITYFNKLNIHPPYPSSTSPLDKITAKNKDIFLISVPLSIDDKLIGVIVATGIKNSESLTRKEISIRLHLLSKITENTIKTYNKINHLNNTVNKQEVTNLIESKISEKIPQGIIYLKPDLTVDKVNPAAEYILGYTQEEIYNRLFEDVLIGSDRIAPTLRESLSGDSSYKIDNIKLHRRDGSTFPAEIKIRPVINSKTKKTIRILVFLQDLSNEEKIRLQNQHLERRALVGDMNAIFAHEIRNPINNITTGIQLLERTFSKKVSSDNNIPEGFSNEKEKVIKGLYEDCSRLTHIVDTILSYSSSKSFELIQVDLPCLIKRILARWRPRMKRMCIEQHIEVSPHLPKVLGDRRALEQVFTNLISNSVESMEDTQGGIIAIRIQPIEKPTKTSVRLDLLDTGAGIPISARDRIFEPFFTTKNEGTGLGLAITKQIITRHKGSISVTHLPEGTVFHVTLPAALVSKENNDRYNSAR